jgi:hypothetical protein
LFQESVASEDSWRLVRGIDSSYLPFATIFGRFCWGFGFDLMGPCF